MKTIQKDKTAGTGNTRKIALKTKDKLHSPSEKQSAIPVCKEIFFRTKDGKDISVPVRPEKAARFLTACTGLPRDEHQDRLAEALGYLPPALEQAAAYMKVNGMDCGEYLKLFNAAELDSSKKYTYEDKSIQTVYNTWQVSMKEIGRKSKKTVGRSVVRRLLRVLFFFAVSNKSAPEQLLNLLAFFAPDYIDNRWFRHHPACLPQPLKKVAKNDSDYDHMLTELARYSLIRLDSPKINLHPLFQQTIRDSLQSRQYAWIRRCLRILNKLRYEDFSTDDAREYFLKLVPHILSITELAAGKIVRKVSNMYTFLGYGYNKIANYPQAVEWYLKAYAIREKLLGREHPAMAISCNNIAAVYYNQNLCAEAAEWYLKALAIREKAKVKEQLSTAGIYKNVAIVYHSQGKYAEALEMNLKAYGIGERLQGKDHPDTAVICSSIAAACDGLGRRAEALEWYLKDVTVREKTLGKDHFNLALASNNIAYLYNHLARYDEALEWYQRVLAIREKELGKNHPDTANASNNIAIVYSNLNEYDKALEWHLKALAVREKVLGRKHPDTVATSKSIALVHRTLGNSAEAVEWNLKDSVANEKFLGIEHLSTATAYNDLALVYKNQGKYEKALKMFLATYKMHLAKYGAGHSYTGNIKTKLEWTYNKTAPQKPFDEWLAEKMKESR
ncbi:MAG: tetratricopeptide repeat protein [Tannerella sp.]|jgi:tetratricopeptide (TPR) repeat protein|nr:tetratricopeptide repeat protein [Tannerella sp.]